MMYSDDLLSFEVPDGSKVKKLREGHYCLTGDKVATLTLLDQATFDALLSGMEGNTQFLSGCSAVTQAQIGSSQCYIQTGTRPLPGSRQYTELTYLIKAANALYHLRVEGIGTINIDKYQELVASLSKVGKVAGKRVAKKGLHTAKRIQKVRTGNKPRQGQIAHTLVFADNYQFCLYDIATEPFPRSLSQRISDVKRGWRSTESALWCFTKAHSNCHRVDLFLSDKYEPDELSSRVFVVNLSFPSGKLVFLLDEPGNVAEVKPGKYSVYVRTFNPGFEDNQLVDGNEILARDDLERYEFVLVPGFTASEGLVKGSSAIDE